MMQLYRWLSPSVRRTAIKDSRPEGKPSDWAAFHPWWAARFFARLLAKRTRAMARPCFDGSSRPPSRLVLSACQEQPTPALPIRVRPHPLRPADEPPALSSLEPQARGREHAECPRRRDPGRAAGQLGLGPGRLHEHARRQQGAAAHHCDDAAVLRIAWSASAPSQQSDDTSLRATFEFSGEGMTWTARGIALGRRRYAGPQRNGRRRAGIGRTVPLHPLPGLNLGVHRLTASA